VCGTDLCAVRARLDEVSEWRILKWHEALDIGVDEEAHLPTEPVDLVPDHSSRPMTARLQIWEVLLTASMSEVFLRLGDPVLARDSSLRKSDAESMLVESRQTRTLSQRQPAVPVEPARQFDLHRPLTLSRTQRQAVQGLLIQFKGDAHVSKLAIAHPPDKAGPGCS
jgi:hypothetical protein